MEHPNSEQREKQKQFLRDCPPGQREFHAKMFRTGNAAIHYHREAQQEHQPTQEDFNDWLLGLPDNIRRDMTAKGFQECRAHFPFTRHVMERRDIGMEAWMKQHLSEEDYQFWQSNSPD